ncbi:MAG: oligosaccharide flippase family protein [Flavipsychrobacter sp.]
MSVGKSASQGFVSFFIRNMLDKILGMVAMVILARKLTPYDFGLVSITEVLLWVITAFGTAGVAEFLLAYRKKDTRKIFKAAFWFNFAITIAIIVVFLGAAPFWADYQGDDRIITISFISAAIFFFAQLQVIPKTLLTKNLEYQKQVKIQTPFIILVQFSKIGAVYAGLGVYSLIIPSLFFQPILTFFLYRGARLNPGLKLYTERWREIFAFTKHLIGANLLARIADEGDKIILSTFLGLETLGVYNIAMQLANLFISPFVMISNNVLASVLPRFVDDNNKFYHNYMSFLKAFIFVVFPLLAMMVVSAKPIILTLYGTKWLAAVIPLQILLIYTATRTATSSFGVLMSTLHLTRKTFNMNLIYTPIHIVGALIGGSFGMIGIAISMVIVKTLFTIVPVKYISTALEIPFSKWFRDIAPYWLSVVFIAVGFLIVGSIVPLGFDIHPFANVCILSAAFIGLYYLVVRVFLVKELYIISSFLGHTVPKARRYFNVLFGL